MYDDDDDDDETWKCGELAHKVFLFPIRRTIQITNKTSSFNAEKRERPSRRLIVTRPTIFSRPAEGAHYSGSDVGGHQGHPALQGFSVEVKAQQTSGYTSGKREASCNNTGREFRSIYLVFFVFCPVVHFVLIDAWLRLREANRLAECVRDA